MDTQQFITETRPHPFLEGEQTVYRFPNGYGASVIPVGDYQTRVTDLGVVEVAVLDAHGITYETPVTDDVIVVSVEEMPALLERIASL